jgi:aminoglycoside 6'-N-acetyltransferase I
LIDSEYSSLTPPHMRIVGLEHLDEGTVAQVAQLLVSGFSDMTPTAWPNHHLAQAEVRGSLLPHQIALAALVPDGRAVGWIRGIRQWGGHAWQLYPLVIHPDFRDKGVGTALVIDLESRVRDSGGLTLWLTTADTEGQTSLAGTNLYDDPFRQLRALGNPGHHRYNFYEQLGFVVVGAIPDANGLGKPDILLAKTVRSIR